MTNVVPLHKCVCGEVGLPRTMVWKDEMITFFHAYPLPTHKR